jgi:hypothetical protein
MDDLVLYRSYQIWSLFHETVSVQGDCVICQLCWPTPKFKIFETRVRPSKRWRLPKTLFKMRVFRVMQTVVNPVRWVLWNKVYHIDRTELFIVFQKDREDIDPAGDVRKYMELWAHQSCFYMLAVDPLVLKPRVIFIQYLSTASKEDERALLIFHVIGRDMSYSLFDRIRRTGLNSTVYISPSEFFNLMCWCDKSNKKKDDQSYKNRIAR